MARRIRRSHGPDFVQKVMARVKLGGSVRAIARDFDISNGLVYRWMEKEGIRSPRKMNGGGGGPRLITERFKLEDTKAIDALRDATIYLKHARREILKDSNTGSLSRANLLTLLALDTLEGR